MQIPVLTFPHSFSPCVHGPTGHSPIISQSGVSTQNPDPASYEYHSHPAKLAHSSAQACSLSCVVNSRSTASQRPGAPHTGAGAQVASPETQSAQVRGEKEAQESQEKQAESSE